MKHLISFIVAILSCLTVFAQGEYDPENPGDPNPCRELTVLASPKAGGTANTSNDSVVAAGQTVSCYASENRYYQFVHWLKNGEIASTKSNYEFIMPDENVEMVAVFELNYNPESPGDPQEAKPSHRVTLTASPGKGGRFNNSVFKLCQGETTHVYAYPNESYKFEEWLLDGVLVSTKNPLVVKMTDKDLNFTARFSYDPINPTDPGANLFVPGTGEMVVDRFEHGYLSSAISLLLDNKPEYSDIQSLAVSGIMDGADFGIMYYLTNCSVIDLSRTSGYTEIPSYAFETTTALTELMLPSCINAIGSYALQGCKNLSVLTCHAIIPPTLGPGVFDGVDKGVVIKVPSQSVDVYKNASGWKDFTILPADADVYSISVTLPSDAKDSRYKNMCIELLNTLNGQRYKYLITDKTEYVFGNLLSSTKYSVSVRNAKNEILGEIADLEVIDKDLTISFPSLLQPRNVSVKILTPDGQDVTKDVAVKWFNASNELLQQGPLLAGVLENSVISYTIILPQQLQNIYLQPASQTLKISDSNSLVCVLEAIGKCVLSGKVYDTDNQPVSGAIITISQGANGTYTNSVNVHCANDGKYSVELPDVPVKVAISANGYIGQTKDLQSASIGIGDVVLEKNTGLSIYPSYTFQGSVATGEKPTETDLYSDDANIAYRIEDINGNEIPDCIYQAASIILPESIELGDNVIVTAYSKNNKFKEVSQAILLASKISYVSLPIVEYGGISVTAEGAENQSNICILYDASGKQVGKGSLRNGVPSFANLPDGRYSLIVMNRSGLLSSVQSLSSLKETPLEEGVDYLISEIDVRSGQTYGATITNVPSLDETKLYFTNSHETYFMSNKQQLTIGNYVTLKAKITMKDEYADVVDAATLIVDIPANCEFVDNSIISGSGYLGYEYSGNRLSIPIQQLSDAVRFCIVPLEGGECKPSAFVKLVIDNEEILQPIGSAYFEAKNFSLFAPQKTARTTIAIRGTATPDSEVKIYDNDIFVGTTYSMPNGEWATSISFVKPYRNSLHSIYAEIISHNGQRLITETNTVDYDASYPELSTVTMLYGKDRFIFDQINGRTNVSNYIYWVHPDGNNYQPEPKFTFIADFTNNDPDIIRDVVFKVKKSDGSVRRIPGEYNETSGNWTATSRFTETQAPVNVTAEYIINRNYDSFSEEAFKDQISGLTKADSKLFEIFNNEVSISTDLDEEKLFKGSLLYGDYSIPFKVELLDFDYVYGQLMYEKQFYPYGSERDKTYYRIESTDSQMSYILVEANEKFALNVTISIDDTNDRARAASWSWVNTMRQSFNNGSFLRRFTGAMGDFLDIFGLLDYINVRGDFNLMLDNAVRYSDEYINMRKKTMELALAQCADGSYRLSPGQLKLLEIDLNYLSERETSFSDKYYKYLTDYKWALGWNVAGNIASLGVGKLIGAATRFIKKGGSIVRWYNRHINSFADTETVGETITNSLGIAYGGIQEGIDQNFHPAFYDFNGVRDKLWAWSNAEFMGITKEFIRLNEMIKQGYHDCPEDEEDNEEDYDDYVSGNDKDDDNFTTPPITPSIDPSGYVFEAVPSNRIPGVTATAYFKQQHEDMYGDVTETAVVWDATPFGQENPLTTDAQGMYAWDVPAGTWQVKFEKEGYETAQSAWLPVPPPQLDINIAMTQAKQPEVRSVHAYSDGVMIEFDKFMLPSTLTLGNITVTQNGTVVKGDIVAANIELDVNGTAFCSKVEFKPAEPLADGEAMLFVSKSVRSYANINMGEDFSQAFTVEPRIKEIKVNEQLNVNSGSTVRVTATIVPTTAAQGKTIIIKSLNDLIATVSTEKCTPDANGVISFDVRGIVIGNSGINISIEDYDIDATVKVNVIAPREEKQVGTPYASTESGEVVIGTEVYLYCETENASIYYTLDGSCPCDVNRLKYDGSPIIVTKNLTLKIIAEAEGMIDSDIVEYQYTVKSAGIGDIQIDKDLNIYPLPLDEYLNISNGDCYIDEVSIFDLNGNRMVQSNKPEKQVSLRVGFLKPGLYLLNVETNGKSIVRKVIKR